MASPQFPEESARVARPGGVGVGLRPIRRSARGRRRLGPRHARGDRLGGAGRGAGIPVQAHVSTNYEKGERHMAQLLALAAAVPQGATSSPTPSAAACPTTTRTCGAAHRPRRALLGGDPRLRQRPRPGPRPAPVGAERLIAGTDWTNRIGPPYLPYGVLFDVPDAASPIGRRALRSLDDMPYEPSVPGLGALPRAGRRHPGADRPHRVGERGGAAGGGVGATTETQRHPEGFNAEDAEGGLGTAGHGRHACRRQLLDEQTTATLLADLSHGLDRSGAVGTSRGSGVSAHLLPRSVPDLSLPLDSQSLGARFYAHTALTALEAEDER